MTDELPSENTLCKPEKLKPEIRDAALKRLMNGDSTDSITTKFGQPVGAEAELTQLPRFH